MAETLERETEHRVEIAKGRLGDLRLTLEGEELFATNRLLYPRARTVLQRVRGKLPR